jgi:glycyl-tRNA synthetase beta chain
MSSTAPLLLEIGCEEIPARMIRDAAAELRDRLVALLDRAQISHGEARAWGGARRLVARVDGVAGHQPDHEEQILGPPASVAFDGNGRPTPAALGFASRHGVEPSALDRVETARGSYAGLRRRVAGRTLGDVLASGLRQAVEAIPFPKTMRWGDGSVRWVRPVHWLLALHGSELLPIELFGVRASNRSVGHRFLSAIEVPVHHPDDYHAALRRAGVVVDPEERQRVLGDKLHAVARQLGARLVDDPALLVEAADLVEWPEVVAGRFDERYLELPREILITTLRRHQKCFSVQDVDGRLLPHFLAISNNDRDRGGHIRRGNEWVASGRLEDARFFWYEDRKRPLGSLAASLERLAFHARRGSYADKARRLSALAASLAGRAGLDPSAIEPARRAASLAKNDLVTGTVGEFPELQGIVGGLLLRYEGQPDAISRAVYDHYKPVGPEDSLPTTPEGSVVSIADKLDNIAELILAGEFGTGAKDPFGLRRAANGVFRIVLEQAWSLSLQDLADPVPTQGRAGLLAFLRDRLENFLRERGYGPHEVRSVALAGGSGALDAGALPDLIARLDALAAVRARADFRRLVELTKRVANILRRNAELAQQAVASPGDGFEDPEPVVRELESAIHRLGPLFEAHSREGDYAAVVGLLASLVEPVDRLFDGALIIDPNNPNATAHRLRILVQLRDLLTRYFDIAELAGGVERRDACPS